MIFRICYSNELNAKENNLPKTGTIVEIENIEDLIKFRDVVCCELILLTKLPGFLDWRFQLWGEDCIEIMSEEHEDVYDHHIVPITKDWVTCQWIEVYNGYRE